MYSKASSSLCGSRYTVDTKEGEEACPSTEGPPSSLYLNSEYSLLNFVTRIIEPSFCIVFCNRKNSFVQKEHDIQCHHHLALSYVQYHLYGKCKLWWRRKWALWDCSQVSMVGEKYITFPYSQWVRLGYMLKFELEKLDLPTCYHLQNVWLLVNATVVHYNHRVWHRKWINSIQQATDKTSKTGCVVGASNDVYIEDTLMTQCQKYGISVMQIS